MQYDVFANPVPRARRAYPLLAVLQSNLAETGSDCIVAFITPAERLPALGARLVPIVSIQGKNHALLLPSLTNLPVRDLRDSIANLGAYRDRITAGLDWLFLGL